MELLQIPSFHTTQGIARRAGCSRLTVQRQLAQAIIRPDAFLFDGTARQPLFLEERALTVVLNARPAKST